MNKLLISLAVLGLALLPSTPALAAHYWELKMSDPSSSNQTRTFNIDFVTLSEESTDQFTVRLYQNNVELASKTTTKPYGDSGSFQVTVPADGTYTYHMTATTTGGEEIEEKTTPEKAVTVSTPTEGGQSNVTTTGGSTTSNSGRVADSSTTRNRTTNGTVQGNNSAVNETGQVDSQAVTDVDGQDVLGEETDVDADSAARNRGWWLMAAIIGILAALYYWFYARRGQLNPFTPKED